MQSYVGNPGAGKEVTKTKEASLFGEASSIGPLVVEEFFKYYMTMNCLA